MQKRDNNVNETKKKQVYEQTSGRKKHTDNETW